SLFLLAGCGSSDSNGQSTSTEKETVVPDAVLNGGIEGISDADLRALIKREEAAYRDAMSGMAVPIQKITEPGAVANLRSKMSAEEVEAEQAVDISDEIKNGVPGAKAKLLKQLASEDIDERETALRKLCWHLKPEDISREELEPAILALVDERKELLYAPQAMCTWRMSDWQGRMQKLLDSPEPTDRQKAAMIGQLGHGESTNSLIDQLAKKAKQHLQSDDRTSLRIVKAVIHTYEDLSPKADAQQLKKMEQTILDLLKSNRLSKRNRARATGALAQIGGPASFDMLHQSFKENPDRADFLAGMVRIDPKRSRPFIEQSLTDPDRFANAAEAISELAKGTGDQTLLQKLAKGYSKATKRYDLALHFCDAAHAIGGESAFQFAQQHVSNADRQKEALRFYDFKYKPLDENHPVRKMADRMLELRLIDAPIPAEKLKEARDETALYGGEHYEWDLMHASGILAHFDAETGMLPIDYDKLILNYFVPAARGAFDGLQTHLEWHEVGGDAFDHTVRIVHGKFGYVFRPEYQGDWYDVPSVHAAVNQILEDMGATNRFVAIDTGDQSAAFMYGHPGAVRLFMKEFGLH
ncbi:MAG: hypothetical protein AAF570_14675, partial [Bacteroidota bacterium]